MELNNVTCKKVIVSNETLGKHLRLYSVRPYYHYDENNVRTDIIDGYLQCDLPHAWKQFSWGQDSRQATAF